jgi:LPS sulfotransferase NodH
VPALQSYIICATPRSGSTLLCDLLESTGAAGRPASYFRKQSIARWASRLNVGIEGDEEEPVFDRDYIEAVVTAGRGATDLFGLRIMRESGDELSARLAELYPGLTNDRARLEAVFGPSQFIHLSRIDKVSQAVSRVKAMQSGLWHVATDGTERERTGLANALAYDRDEIGTYVEELMVQDESWNIWFGKNGIEPLRLTYEALSQDPESTLAAVLVALGLDPAIASGVEPKTARLSDGESRTWAARFRAETGLSPPGNQP